MREKEQVKTNYSNIAYHLVCKTKWPTPAAAILACLGVEKNTASDTLMRCFTKPGAFFNRTPYLSEHPDGFKLNIKHNERFII